MIAAACAHNPSLAMCATPSVNEQPAEFRAHDAPEDEDTRFMRSFPKVSFDELQTQRYCFRHKEHFQHYCTGAADSVDVQRLRAKLEKFCPSFEKHCPEMASKLATSQQPTEMFREASVPLIVPPPLPNAPTYAERMLLDLPVPTGATKASELYPGQPLQPHQLSADIIRTW